MRMIIIILTILVLIPTVLSIDFIDEERPERWIINQTGLEVMFNITTEIINNTATRFCINDGDLKTYIRKLKKIDYIDFNGTNIPITKLGVISDYDINIDSIDLTKTDGAKCLEITYSEISSNIKIKIGYNSIQLTGDDAVEGLRTNGNAITTYSNGTMIAAFKSGATAQARIIKSYDEGVSWDSNNYINIADDNADDAYMGVGIYNYNDSLLYVAYIGASRYPSIYKSEDYGNNWELVNKLWVAHYGYDTMSCALDKDALLHCCSGASTYDRMYYLLSNGTQDEIYPDNNDDIDTCAVAMNSSGSVFIAGVGTDYDTIYLFSKDDDKWNYTSKYELYDVGAFQTESLIAFDIMNYEGTDYFIIVVQDWLFNSTQEAIWTNWTSNELEQRVITPRIAIRQDSEVIMVAGLSTADTWNKYYNTTLNNLNNFTENGGISWLIGILPHLLHQRGNANNFTKINNVSDKIHIINDYEGGYKYQYTNISIDFRDNSAPPEDTCTYTSGDWNIDCSDNCVVSDITTVTGNIIAEGTGTLNIDNNISCVNLTRSYECNLTIKDGVSLILEK